MASTIHFADDVSLFVLDNDGLLFSETRQELYTCNGPATFIWCCLEEGFAFREIAATYASTFQITQPEADRVVADTLNQWQGLGYITGVDVPAASEIDLTTALGRLLINPELRRDFERSPGQAAQNLSLRQADLEAFLQLHPEELESQAQALEEKKLAHRRGLVADGSTDRVPSFLDRNVNLLRDTAITRLRKLSTHPGQHYYRLLTTTFRIRFGSRAQKEMVHPTLAHLEIQKPASADVVLELVELENSHVVMDDFAPLGYCVDLEQLAPIIKTAVRRMASDRHCYFLQIHAAVLSTGEKCILLPGAPGNGKTTLTAGLARSGFQYFSDEVALLQEEGMRVCPMPISLTVKQEGVDLLTPLYPELPQLRRHRREDQQIVRYLAPLCNPSAREEAACAVGWIIFPRFSPGVETLLLPLSRAEALHRLMRECLVLPEPLNKQKVRTLVQWTREVECFDLPMSSLTTAVQLLKDLCL